MALRDRDLGGVESRQDAEQEGARRGGRLQGTLEGEALLELWGGGCADVQAGAPRATFARAIHDGGSQGEDLHLPLSIAQRLVHQQLRTLCRAGKARLSLASHEAVEGQVGAPRQHEDENRAAKARAE